MTDVKAMSTGAALSVPVSRQSIFAVAFSSISICVTFTTADATFSAIHVGRPYGADPSKERNGSLVLQSLVNCTVKNVAERVGSFLLINNAR